MTAYTTLLIQRDPEPYRVRSYNVCGWVYEVQSLSQSICLSILSVFLFMYVFLSMCVFFSMCVCLSMCVLQVSFAEYSLFDRALLQKRPIILRSIFCKRDLSLHVCVSPCVCWSPCVCFSTYVCACVCVGIYAHLLQLFGCARTRWGSLNQKSRICCQKSHVMHRQAL